MATNEEARKMQQDWVNDGSFSLPDIVAGDNVVVKVELVE